MNVVIVPQVGWQFEPLAVSVQVTPPLAESFSTLALKRTVLLLAGTLLVLLRIDTEIAGCEIVKLSVSVTELLAIDVAVMVG